MIMALALLATVAASCGGDDTPPGIERDRHLYRGETYTLVEYADRLALFDGDGAPVTDTALARAALHSYAWRLELNDFTAETIPTLRKVSLINGAVARAIPPSADLVAALDEIERLEVNVPLVGKVSAQDALLESYPGVAAGIALIRTFDADLNQLARNVSAVSITDAVVMDPATASERDGVELATMFGSAIPAARELKANTESVRDGVATVEEPVDRLASVLTSASATPFIGDSLAGYALVANGFAAGLDTLAGQLEGFSGELDALADQYADAIAATEQRLADDMARWLAEPYDDKWPP